MSQANTSKYFDQISMNDSEFLLDNSLIDQNESIYDVKNFDTLEENVDENKLNEHISQYTKRILDNSNLISNKKKKVDIQSGGDDQKLYY